MAISVIRRTALSVAAFSMFMAPVIGMATANADSNVRVSERGQVSAQGTVKSVRIGAVNPGQVSAGAPIIRDSFVAKPPCVRFIITKGQPDINDVWGARCG